MEFLEASLIVILCSSLALLLVCGCIAGRACKVSYTLAHCGQCAIGWIAMSATGLIILTIIQLLALFMSGAGWGANLASTVCILLTISGPFLAIISGIAALELVKDRVASLSRKKAK